MNTTGRTHVLYLTVGEDRLEMTFTERGAGVDVYTFDSRGEGEEHTCHATREAARVLWTAAIDGGYVWTRSTLPAAPAPVAAPAPAPAAEPPPASTKPGFESETCSRCGGSGKHSRCAMYGDTCFRCAGAGRTLTKRGAAAAAHLRTLRSKRPEEIVVGDVVQIPGGGPFPARWETVDEAWLARGLACGWGPEGLVRVRQSKEQSETTWAAALAYQASLTKAGTVRRSAAAVAA